MREVVDTASAWRPDETQLRVAELLATGYSQNRAAAICGIPQQTISAWWNVREFSPQFQQLVADMAARFNETRVLDQTIRLAELLIHQVVTGERDADDPAVLVARDLCAATSWKVYAQGGHKQFGS